MGRTSVNFSFHHFQPLRLLSHVVVLPSILLKANSQTNFLDVDRDESFSFELQTNTRYTSSSCCAWHGSQRTIISMHDIQSYQRSPQTDVALFILDFHIRYIGTKKRFPAILMIPAVYQNIIRETLTRCDKRQININSNLKTMKGVISMLWRTWKDITRQTEKKKHSYGIMLPTPLLQHNSRLRTN
jgi:hypothetical protein